MPVELNVTIQRHYTSADPAVWRSGQVRSFLGGVSHMWLIRRMADSDFPKPTKIRRRNYWSVAAVQGWLDLQEAGANEKDR
jgi:predicted DNA-binding transcriptional regulator AlpA